jgi:hypothetical protein
MLQLSTLNIVNKLRHHLFVRLEHGVELSMCGGLA